MEWDQGNPSFSPLFPKSLKEFLRKHQRLRYFAIAGAIGACCYLFWLLVLYVPYYCGWVMMPVN